MPDFDPSTNGHRIAAQKTRPAGAGQGILIVSLVSALTGFNLLIGGGVGLIVAMLLGLRERSAGIPVVVLAAVGGAIGVWLGVRVAIRFGGASGSPKATRWAVAGGMAGLVAAVALASIRAGSVFPILAILLPGVGAWLGDRLATRKG